MTILAAEVDWTQVLVTLITVVGTTVSAFIAYLANRNVKLVRRDIKTPSGASIGKQVEDTQHVTLANNFHLRAQGGEKLERMPESLEEVEPRFEP